MIFVTLGSQKFQFNRLLQKLDDLIEDGTIRDPVFAQTGGSDYIPKFYTYERFLDLETYQEVMAECSLVITHGGTGAIISAVKKGKKVIAAPRLAKYGEAVDDHQIQLLTQFEEMNIIKACFDLEKLGMEIRAVPEKVFSPYQSNTKAIIESIAAYIERNK